MYFFPSTKVIWALGNIVGDSVCPRDMVINLGALNKLSSLCSTEFTKHSALPLIRLISWILSNLLQWKPIPDWKHVQIAIDMLSLLLTLKNRQILRDSCFALSYLCDPALGGNTKRNIEEIKSNGSLNRVVSLLNHKKRGVRHGALRVCGNIAIGNNEQTQCIVDFGVLKPLHRMIESDEPVIVREACWTVSNITAGSSEQIDAVIAANLFPPLIECVTTGTYEIAHQAAWALVNAASSGSKEQIMYLAEQGAIPSLCAFSRRISKDKELMNEICEAIKNTKSVKDRGAVIDALKQMMPKNRSECWQCAISMQGKKRFTCSDCQRPTYCGKHCQKRHWHRHRTDCKDQCHILETLSNYSASLCSETSKFKQEDGS